MIKRALALLCALAVAGPALGQSITMPSQTVYGRTAIGSGPGQAIPFSILKQLVGVTAPATTTVGDMAFWADTVGATLGDAPLAWNPLAGASGNGQFVMTAPSGLLMNAADVTTVSNFTVFGGSVAVGQAVCVQLNYKNASGAQRNVPFSYTPVGGDTISTVTTAMKAALIAAGATQPLVGDLAPFRLVSGGTVGTSGGTTLAFNFYWLAGANGTPTLTFTNCSAAGSTVTMSFNGTPETTGNTASNPNLTLDVVATIGHIREASTTRAGLVADNVWFDNWIGNDSAGNLATFATMNVYKINVTPGSILGHLSFAGGQSTTVSTFHMSKGLWQDILGGGVPVPVYFGATDPFTTGVADLGIHTFVNGGYGLFGHALVGLWPANTTYALFGTSVLDQSVATNYALVQGAAGDTLLNASTGQTIEVRIGNVSKATVSATAITNKVNTIAPSIQLSGTAALGFLEYPVQSSNPAAPAAGFRAFADASGRNSWIRQSDGFVRTFDAVLTANRVYTLPDASGTLTALGNTTTGSGSIVLATTPTFVTSLITPIINATSSLLLQTNAGTFAGAINASQQWLISQTNVTLPTNNALTISKGTANPIATSTGHALLQMQSADATQSFVLLDQYGNTGSGPFVVTRVARGTGASATAVQNGDMIGFFGMVGATGAGTFAANDGSAGGVYFGARATENWSGTNQGAKMQLYGTANGSNAITNVAILQQGIQIGAPTGGDKGVGTINAAGAYWANGTTGVTCNAGFSATTGRSVNGIVTAC